MMSVVDVQVMNGKAVDVAVERTGGTSIPEGYIKPSGTKVITENGTHDVKNYETADVNVVSKPPVIEPLTITEDGTYTAPEGVDGYSPISVTAGSKNDAEIAEQTELIAQIKDAVENLPDAVDSYYDYFWDAYQENGTKTDYRNAFRNAWTNAIFKPKYDIIPINANGIFSGTGLRGDLVQLLETAGVILDLSKATSAGSAFYQMHWMLRLGVIDLTSASDTSAVFQECSSLETIDKVILKSDGTQNPNMFYYLPRLMNLTVEGVIGKSGMTLAKSVILSKASIISVVNALSTTTSGLSATLSLAAVNKAFETSSGANNGSTSAEWLALAATRSNWTISLA